jgi:hypothetical protein
VAVTHSVNVIRFLKFHENPPTGSPLLQADGLKDGQTDMTKLTVALPNFANAPKMGHKFSSCVKGKNS